MSYGEYKFGDFMKNYDVGGPSDGLVGFAEGFAAGFVPAYAAANKAGADKELALAKLDKQAEIDAAEAKAKTTSDYNEMMKKAKNIVSTLQLPTGINPNDAVMTAYTMLSGGISDNTVLTQLSKAIEDKTLVYSDGSPTETAPTTTPEEAPEGAPASPLDQEMNEAFGDQSAVQPAPEAEPTVVSQDDTPAETDGEPVQEASLGSEWAQRFVDRQEARINAASETQIAALDTQTDVTNPEGLGGGSDSAADIVLADADGVATPSERTAATVRTLKINPLAKTAAAEEIEVNKIDDYEKAMAAVVALTGAAGQEDKLKRAQFLLKQFTDTPKVGDMNEQQLDAFIRQTNSVDRMPPEYKGIDPQVMNALRVQAIDFLEDTRNKALPSLSTTDPEELRGVQRDIKAGRLSNTSVVYRNQLAQRIAALDLKVEAERVAGLTPEQAVQEAQRAFIAGLAEDLSFEEKKAAIETWQNTEGQLLLSVMRFTDKPDAPQEVNSFEEAAIVELMASDTYKNANRAVRLDLIEQTKTFLSKQPEGSLTAAKYADMVANYTMMLSSENPEERAAANKWFETMAPSLEAGLQAGARATTRPGDPKMFQIQYTDTQGNTRRAEAVQTDNGYQIVGGTGPEAVIPQSNILSVVSQEGQEYINKQLSATRTERTVQRGYMTSLIDLTNQAYALEQIAVNDPVVLTLVGSGTATLVTAKREAATIVDLITRTAEAAYIDKPGDEGNATNLIQEALSKFMQTNGVTEETANNYRAFSAKLTRFVFAAGKALGQEGNGFSNQDYRNILSSLKAGNGIEAFVGNLRSFVSERAAFVDTGANSLKSLEEIIDLEQRGAVLGYSAMTFDEYSKSEFAPMNYTEWLNSPVPTDKPQSGAENTSPVSGLNAKQFEKIKLFVSRGISDERIKEALSAYGITDVDAAMDAIKNAGSQ